jgi:hypothetical protein
MSRTIKKLQVFDFDGTLCDSPMPDMGKKIFKEKTGNVYPHKGWWGRPESLDINMFEFNMFDKVLNLLNKENSNPESYVMVLTSRMEKLRPQLSKILSDKNIHVNKLDMKKNEKTKGEKILDYIKEFPKLKEIDVFDDRDSDIESYMEIESKIPKNIKFRIHLAKEGELSLVNGVRGISEIINEEIIKFIKKIKGLYL